MIKDYILRIKYELEKAGLPEDVINEVHKLLTEDRLSINKLQKLKAEHDKIEEILKIELLNIGFYDTPSKEFCQKLLDVIGRSK